MENNKFKKELTKLMEMADVVTENTELYQYIKQLNDMMGTDGISGVYDRKYAGIVDSTLNNKAKKPFLSVILRSQGNRPLGLRESLLCLRAQTNQDFEILLICHKANEEGKTCIKEIMDDQPSVMKDKIRFFELNEGTRTTPINFGFANARGQYVSIYDDDDILFDNWVEEFYKSSVENYGKILHAYVLAQKWKVIKAKRLDEEGYMALDAPTLQFCERFDYLSQLVLNKCPLMSLAFPVYLFQKMGIVFNEELNVTEDWEYFMRVVSITGVADIEEATSIYRLWSNMETSATIHAQDIWKETYGKIQSEMNAKRMLIPNGYAQHIISLIHRCNEDDKKMPIGYPKLQGILYYGVDWDFSDERMVIADNSVYSPKLQLSFSVPDTGLNYQYFRIDPSEYGGYVLTDIKIVMNTTNGGRIEVNLSDCKHNGTENSGEIYFMHYDPQIAWIYSGDDKIKSIELTGRTYMEIPEELIVKSIKEYGILGKVSLKAKKTIKRVMEK